MAFQGLLKTDEKVEDLGIQIKGSELVGCKVNAPNAVHKEVYVLPMETVSANKVSLTAVSGLSEVESDHLPGNRRRHLRPVRLARRLHHHARPPQEGRVLQD